MLRRCSTSRLPSASRRALGSTVHSRAGSPGRALSPQVSQRTTVQVAPTLLSCKAAGAHQMPPVPWLPTMCPSPSKMCESRSRPQQGHKATGRRVRRRHTELHPRCHSGLPSHPAKDAVTAPPHTPPRPAMPCKPLAENEFHCLARWTTKRQR